MPREDKTKPLIGSGDLVDVKQHKFNKQRNCNCCIRCCNNHRIKIRIFTVVTLAILALLGYVIYKRNKNGCDDPIRITDTHNLFGENCISCPIPPEKQWPAISCNTLSGGETNSSLLACQSSKDTQTYTMFQTQEPIGNKFKANCLNEHNKNIGTFNPNPQPINGINQTYFRYLVNKACISFAIGPKPKYCKGNTNEIDLFNHNFGVHRLKQSPLDAKMVNSGVSCSDAIYVTFALLFNGKEGVQVSCSLSSGKVSQMQHVKQGVANFTLEGETPAGEITVSCQGYYANNSGPSFTHYPYTTSQNFTQDSSGKPLQCPEIPTPAPTPPPIPTPPPAPTPQPVATGKDLCIGRVARPHNDGYGIIFMGRFCAPNNYLLPSHVEISGSYYVAGVQNNFPQPNTVTGNCYTYKGGDSIIGKPGGITGITVNGEPFSCLFPPANGNDTSSKTTRKDRIESGSNNLRAN